MDLMAIKCEPAANEACPIAEVNPAGEAADTEQSPFAAMLGEQVKQLLELLTDEPVLESTPMEPMDPSGKPMEPEAEKDDPHIQSLLACVVDMQVPAEITPVPQKTETAGVAPAPQKTEPTAGLTPSTPIPLPQTGLPTADIKTQPDAVAPETSKRRPGLDSFADDFPAGWEKLFTSETEPMEVKGKPETPQVLEKVALPIARTTETPPQTVLDLPNAGEPGLVKGTEKNKLPTVSTPEFLDAAVPAATTQDRDFGQSIQPITTSREETGAEGGNSHVAWHSELLREAAVTAAAGASGKVSVQVAATPAQVLTRMNEVQKQEVVEHFVRSSVPAISRNGEDAVWVELYPPELGKVRVWVENSGHQVNAVLTVQDSGIRDLFQEQMGSLRRGLEESGLKLGELSVEIRQDGKSDERQAAEAQAGKRTYAGWEGKPWVAGVPKTWSQTWPQEATGRVDVMV